MEGCGIMGSSMTWIITLLLVTTASATCPSADPEPIQEFKLQNIVGTPNTSIIIEFGSALQGSCMVAMWVVNDVIYETQAEQASDLGAYTTSFDNAGTYTVALYLANNNSLNYALATVEVDIAIEGYQATSVTNVEMGKVTWLDVPLTSGTRFCVFIDWDDGLVENYCFDDYTKLSFIGHIYDEPGGFTVTVVFSNSLNVFMASDIAWVEYKVVGLVVAAEYAVPYPPGFAYIVFTAPDPDKPPSHAICNGTTDTLEPISVYPNFTQNVTQNMSVEFTDVGYRRIVINCSNHISFQSGLEVEIQVDEPISGANLTGDVVRWPYLPYGLNKTYTLTVSNGSNISTSWDFGLGGAAVLLPFPSLSASSTPLTTVYKYSVEGEKTLKITLSNCVGTEIVEVNLTIVITFTEVNINGPPFAAQIVNFSVEITTPNGVPNIVDCEVDYNDGEMENFTVNKSGNVIPETEMSHNFTSYGEKNISVRCKNIVTDITTYFAIEVREPIAGFRAVVPWPDPLPAVVSQPAVFSVFITNGTSVTVNVSCEFVSLPGEYDSFPMPPSLEALPYCNYTDPGDYTVYIKVYNGVSVFNGTFYIKALHAITDFVVTSKSGSTVASPPGTVTLEYTVNQTNPPNDVNLEIIYKNGDSISESGTNMQDFAAKNPQTQVYTFASNILGNVTIDIMLYNLVSNVTKPFDAWVLQPISAVTLSLESGSVFFPALIPATIVIVTDGSEVTFNLDLGDGTPHEIWTDSELPAVGSYSRTTTYTTTGEFTMVVQVSNALGGSKTDSLDITVRWPLVEQAITLEHPPVVAIQDSTADLIIADDVTNITQRATSVNVTVSSETTTIFPTAVVPGWPKVVTLDYSVVPTLGEMMIFVLLDNVITSVNKNVTIILSEYIEGQFLNGPPVVMVDTEAVFDFGYTKGWKVSINVNLGDGSPSVDIEEGVLTYSHSYRQDSDYTFTVVFKNDVSNLNETHVISVREKLNLTLTTNSPVSYPGTLNLTFALPSGRLAAIVSFKINFGDGTVTENTIHITDGVYEERHSYAKFGSYEISIEVDNIVSAQKMSQVAQSDVPISGLNFTVFSLVNDTEDGEIMYEPDVPVHFKAFIETGSRVNYTFDMGGFATLAGPVAAFNFTEDGTHLVTVVATNYLETINVTRPVKVASPVGMIKYIQEDKIYLVDNLNITVEFDVPKNLCIHFLFEGKKTLNLWFETKEGLCLERDPDATDVRPRQNRSVLYFLPLFPAPGHYDETLFLFTELKSQEKHYELFVQRYACEDPGISTLKKAGKWKDDPRIIFRSQYLIVTSEDMDASTNCRETSFFLPRWAMYSINAHDGSEELVVNPAVDTSKNLYMAVEERGLPLGMYRVELTIYMKEYESFNSSDNLFVEVIASPLKVGIYPDELRQQGNVRLITMNAERETEDPDSGNNIGIDYVWFCQPFGEYLNISTNPAYDGIMDTISIPAPEDTAPSGGGGCFGQGAGIVDTTEGSFTFNPKHTALGKYVFTVRVSKDTRVSMAQQVLTIVDGNPVEAIVKRDTVPECPKRYNAVGQLDFYSECLDCKGLVPNYDWQVAAPNGAMVDLGSTKSVDIIGGGVNTKLVLTGAPLLPGTDYMLKLHIFVENDMFTDGLTEVKLTTSSPPVGGTCSVIPTKGVFLADRFSIECVGWEDDDISPGVTDAISTTMTATSAGKTSKVVAPMAFLPLGDPAENYTVIVSMHVADPCGSSTTVNQTVQVLPAQVNVSQAEYALSVFGSLDPEGMRLASSTIATSVLAAMASFDLDDPNNAKLQKQLLKVMSNLLLVNESYPGSALLAMTDAIEVLSETLTLASGVDALDTMFSLMDTLADNLGQQRTVSDLTRMSTGITGVAEMCLKVQFSLDETKENTVPDPDAIPSALEEAPPEEQERVREEERTLLKIKLKKVENVHTAVMGATLQTAVDQGHDVQLGKPNFRLAVTLTTKDNITDTDIKTSKISARPLSVAGNDYCGWNTIFWSSYVKGNMYGWPKSSEDVSGRIASLKMMASGSLEPVDFYGLVNVDIDMDVEDRLEVNMTSSVVDVNTSMIYFTLPIDDPTLGFVLDFEPVPDLYDNQTLQVFIKLRARLEYLYKPKQTLYDLKFYLPRNTSFNPWSIVVPENVEKVPLAYIGVLLVNSTYNDSLIDDEQDLSSDNAEEIVPDDMILKNSSTFPFRVFAIFSTCRSWDTKAEQWVMGVCTLANETTTRVTRCACTSFTQTMDSLSPGFTPPGINTIDFSKVFGNFAALLAENAAVFSVVISTIVVYVVLLVWARRKDIGDIHKWSIQPLIDNSPGDHYLYHVTVMTGMRKGSGTKSNVAFIISGEDCDSGVRTLDDQYHRGFGTGTTRSFIMTTKMSLGILTYFRLWHDNSGKNWFLDKVIVEDVQTGKTYFFLCDRWLAVEEDDGELERVLPVAGDEQILETKNLFFHTSRRKIADEHLWISVFARPERNSFTRAQRLTSGVALLFITMVANAMWYRTSDDATNDTELRLGPIVISLDVLYISVMSSLTSIPISTIIILFFQKSRPKPPKPGQKRTGMEPPACMYKKKEELSKSEALEVKKYKRKYPLPWWCTVVAWVLAVLTILTAGFFVILYSLDWGKVKAEGWLSAFFLCFFQNVFIIQPVKVFAIAFLISCIFKKLDEADEKKELLETKKTDAPSALDEEIEESKDISPLKGKELARAQYIGRRDKMVWQTFQEMVFYIVFLILVMYLAWGSRNNNDFFMRRSVQGMLSSKAQGDYMSIKKVSDGHKMWHWLQHTLVPNMYWQKYYTGSPTPRWARAYLNDLAAVRLGTVRLRQLRVKDEVCHHSVTTKQCQLDYGFFSQEDNDFTPGWANIANNTENLKDRLRKAFTFQSFLKLQNIPYIGAINTYGGGGYVAELGSNSASAIALIRKLIENNWVDKQTRAVFFETTMYNANVHLFASIVCLFEFPATGGVLPRLNVDTFHAYAGVGISGQITLGLMITFCLILIGLIVHEALKFKSAGGDYFKNPWNTIEVLFLCLSIISVGMYSAKEAYTRYITKKIGEDKDGNIGYMQLSTYEIGYNAVVGLTSFIATFKMLRLLNFSKQVRDLALSMRLVRKDLLSYAIVFSCVYMAFGMFGMLVFGRHMYDYSTFVRAIESLYSTLLGKFNYAGLYQTNPILGPLFLIFFAITIMFVLVNLFIGIVVAAFAEARFDTSGAFNNDVWTHLWHKLMVFLCLEKPIEPEVPFTEDTDDPSSNTERGNAEAMKPDRRAALQSLDNHLHFLDRYVEEILQKEKAAASKPGRDTSEDSCARPAHVLDVDTALMWDDIPDSILQMALVSTGTVSKKPAAAEKAE